jgi:hypothetical protein
MFVLPYGRKRLENGDRGNTVFDALNYNIDRDDAHNHDGVNGEKIKTSNLAKTTVLVDASFPATISLGIRSYVIPLPIGYSYSTINTRYFFAGTVGGLAGGEFYPSVTVSGSNLVLKTCINAASNNISIVLG